MDASEMVVVDKEPKRLAVLVQDDHDSQKTVTRGCQLWSILSTVHDTGTEVCDVQHLGSASHSPWIRARNSESSNRGKAQLLCHPRRGILGKQRLRLSNRLGNCCSYIY